MRRLEYYSRIAFQVLSLVSKTKKWLKTKDPRHQMVKKMNRAPGLPLRRSSVTMGKRMITRDALIQLEAVEKATMLGWTISGMQSHTTGPKERPNTAMNMNRPMRIKGSPAGLSPLMKNPIITRPQAIPSNSAPQSRMVLLPNFTSRYEVTKVASTCSRLMRAGMSSSSSPLVASEAIFPPQMATPLIPENCCMTAR